MAFISKLAEMKEQPYTGKMGISLNDPLVVDIFVTGHKTLGQNFQALDGGIRGAAAIGTRNAARSILRIALLQTPYDLGDLHASGKIVKGESESEGMLNTGAIGRQIGSYRPGQMQDGEIGGVTESDEPVDDRMDDTPQESFRKAITSYHVLFDDPKAWFVHEFEGQNYRQAGEPTYSSEHPHAGRAIPTKSTVPDSKGRRRGAYYLKRAADEVGANYPDWVAAEIERMLGSFKPAEAPKVSMAPRLVKRK